MRRFGWDLRLAIYAHFSYCWFGVLDAAGCGTVVLPSFFRSSYLVILSLPRLAAPKFTALVTRVVSISFFRYLFACFNGCLLFSGILLRPLPLIRRSPCVLGASNTSSLFALFHMSWGFARQSSPRCSMFDALISCSLSLHSDPVTLPRAYLIPRRSQMCFLLSFNLCFCIVTE